MLDNPTDAKRRTNAHRRERGKVRAGVLRLSEVKDGI